jgi:hypothetical protein
MDAMNMSSPNTHIAQRNASDVPGSRVFHTRFDAMFDSRLHARECTRHTMVWVF